MLLNFEVSFLRNGTVLGPQLQEGEGNIILYIQKQQKKNNLN